MNKKIELKNGMSFITREGNEYYVIGNIIYKRKNDINLELVDFIDDFFKKYEKDLKDKNNFMHYDIMKIFDVDNKLIWEREKVDWINEHDEKNFYEMINWEQCKLAEKPKEKREKPHITYKYIEEDFNKFCKEFDVFTCDWMDEEDSFEKRRACNSCFGSWIKRNFDYIIKEYYSEEE